MNKVIIILILIVQVLFLTNFFQCHYFNEPFYIHTRDVNLQLEGDIHGSKLPLWTIRLFHNKIEAYAIAFYDSYFYYFYFPFLLYFLSPAGLLGLLSGTYFVITRKKSRLTWFALTAVVIAPAIGALVLGKLPFKISLFALWLSFVVFSLYGYHTFLTHQKSKLIIILTTGIALGASIAWFLFYNDGIGAYCHIVH